MSPSDRDLPSAEARRSLVASVRFHLARWLPLVGAALVGYLVFPPPAVVVTALPQVGQVADRNVVAPFSFETRKSSEEIASEGESRALSVRPVYRYSPTAYDSALGAARSFFAELERAEQQGPDLLRSVAAARASLGPSETTYLTVEAQRRRVQAIVTHFLAETLSRGVADAGVLRGEPARQLSLRRGEGERAIPRDSILTFADLIDRAEAAATNLNDPVGQRTVRRLVATFYQPTVVPDLALTSARREQLRASVDRVKYYVSAGERITTVGQPVTEVARAKLAALLGELAERGSGHPLLRGAAGALLYNALVMAAFWLLIFFYRRRTYNRLREMVFFGTLFALVLLLTAGLIGLPGTTGAGADSLRDDRGDPPLQRAGGRGGRHDARDPARRAVGDPGQRRPLLRAGERRGGGRRDPGRASPAASLLHDRSDGRGLRARLADSRPDPGMGHDHDHRQRIPRRAHVARHRVAGHDRDADRRVHHPDHHRPHALELSDLGRPLLRRLAQEAPGTWAHSLAMASLCESACNIIGANGLLARVGCYYHDVGKLANPRYFMENQAGGPNPHDEMSPTDSARLIRNHVLDGIALAREAALPDAVKAFIPEHHGTTDITYFLNRARLLAPDGRVNAAEFRYPGPRPQSAETAIAMLADSAEAVVRVLEDRTPERVREAIELLVAQKLASGQLDDAPLSLVDLDRIKREFARVMSGTYHKRTGYPRAAGPTPELETAERA